MKIDIINIVDVVRASEYYGGGEWIEIAKGKNQIASTWIQFLRKIKRILK